MDGTLGSQTAWMLDGSGVQITSGEELAEVIREGARLAGPSACTRSATARTERRSTRSSRPATCGRRSGSAIGSSTRSASRRRTSRRFAALGVACSVQFSHAPSDRDLAERFWPEQADGAYAFRSLWESGALVANGSDAPVEELDPLAGIRAGVRRSIDERPAWHPEQCLTIEEALVATHRQPGLAVPRRAPAREAPPRLSRRPRRPRPRSARVPARRAARRSRSSRRWSAAAGCTTRRRGS